MVWLRRRRFSYSCVAPTAMVVMVAAASSALQSVERLVGAPQPQPQRARAPPISLDELLRGGTPPTGEPVDDSWLGPGPGALPASNVLNGRLTLLDTGSIATRKLRDDLDLYRFPSRRRLPADGSFTVEYARGAASGVHRSDAVPVQEGLQITGDIVWELIFSTGIVWDEPDAVDRGWSRALLPFALSERNANCVHNGLLLVAFQQDAVSGARFQITSETCLYYKVDFWGQVLATYEPQPESEPRFIEARARNVRERFHRLPTAPMAQLALDYPEVDPKAFGQGLSVEHVSALGVTVDETRRHYVWDCSTRTGQVPAGLCDEWILPSYSVAKSVFAGLALMRLAVLFEESDIYTELVQTWLPTETGAAAGDWSNVTLLDCLNMATGNFQSSGYQEDEDLHSDDFFIAETFAGKAAAAFNFPAREPPGKRHIYHTTDTFILTAAMQRFLQRRPRKVDDIWDLVATEIFEPLHLSSAALSSLRTYDAERQPYGGYGLWFKRDDFAKLSHWLRNGEGRVPTTQPSPLHTSGAQVVVDTAALEAALQLDSSRRGLNPNHPSLNLRYNYGFWAQVFDGTAYGCEDDYYQPYLSGYGGIRSVLLGNGAIYYYVSDNGEFPAMEPAVQASRGFGPLC